MYNVAFDSHFGKCPFEKISQTFLDDPSLPFAGVLPKEIIESTFRKYDGLFGGTFYNTDPFQQALCSLGVFATDPLRWQVPLLLHRRGTYRRLLSRHRQGNAS